MNNYERSLIRNFAIKLKNDLESIKKHDSGIIFTGLSGSGKGTLIHFMKKNKNLYAIMSETGDMNIELRNGPNQIF